MRTFINTTTNVLNGEYAGGSDYGVVCLPPQTKVDLPSWPSGYVQFSTMSGGSVGSSAADIVNIYYDGEEMTVSEGSYGILPGDIILLTCGIVVAFVFAQFLNQYTKRH